MKIIHQPATAFRGGLSLSLVITTQRNAFFLTCARKWWKINQKNIFGDYFETYSG